MSLLPVKRVRLTESVTDRLIAMLRNGHFRPGVKLPSERELRLQLAIGRSSVREALQALIGMGLIEASPGRGYFVRASPGKGAPLPQLTPALSDIRSLLELLEARLMLEPEIAALAAKHVTRLDLIALERALLGIAEAVRRGRAVYRTASMFHVEFAKAAHNAALVQMVRSLTSVMAYWGRFLEGAPGRAEQELRLHRDLFECLKRRDPEAMRAKMREHILLTREALPAYLNEGSGERDATRARRNAIASPDASHRAKAAAPRGRVRG